MAYARKYKRRLRMRPRRKVPYKMAAKKAVSTVRKMNIKDGIHYFSRYVIQVDTGTLSTITGSIGATLLARLSDVPNSSEYAALFEQYRIIGVQYTFRLMDNPDANNYINSTVFTNGANFYPKLWWIQDRDDSTVPTLISIRERGEAKCAILKPDRFIKVYVKYPNTLDEIQANLGSTLAQSMRRTWINTEVANVPHWGLKVVLDKMGYAGNTMTVGIDKRYFFAFKGTK